MLLIAAALLAASPQPIGDMPVFNPNGRVQAVCPPISRYEAMKRGGKATAKRLNELPAADAYRAVYRRIDGCVAPIITGYGIGGGRR